MSLNTPTQRDKKIISIPDPAPRAPNRYPWARVLEPVLYLAVLTLVAGSLALHFTPYLPLSGDSAVYMLLAKGLATGHGYAINPGPLEQGYGMVFKYPPFFSAQLALMMKALPGLSLPEWVPIFKGYLAACFLGFLALFYRFSRPFLGAGLSLTVMLLLGLTPAYHTLLGDVLSDPPYYVTSMLAVVFGTLYFRAAPSILTRHGETEPGGVIRRRVWLLIAGLCVVLSIATRPVGVSLLAAFALMGLWKKRWKAVLLVALVSGALMFSWLKAERDYNHERQSLVSMPVATQAGRQSETRSGDVKLEGGSAFTHIVLLNNPRVGSKEGVANSPADFLKRMAKNWDRYQNHFAGILWGYQTFEFGGFRLSPGKADLIGLLCLFPALAGLLLLARNGGGFAALYAFMYFGTLLVFPIAKPRYLLSIHPFLLLGFIQSALWVLGRVRTAGATRQYRVLATLFLMLLGLQGAYAISSGVEEARNASAIRARDEGASPRPTKRGYYKIMRWVKANTPPRSLVVSRHKEVMFLETDRHCLTVPVRDLAEDRFPTAMARYQKQYVANNQPVYWVEDLTSANPPQILTTRILQNQSLFSLVYTEPMTGARVWRLNPPTP